MAEGNYVEEGFRLRALEDATIASLIAARWYGPDLPLGTALPAVTVQQITGRAEESHDGHSGIENAIYQFTCWASCHLDAMRVADRVQRVFDKWRGVLPNQIRVGYMSRVDRHYAKEPGQNVYQIVLDFRVMYRVEI